MTVQDTPGPAVPAHERRDYEVYDFQRPTTLAREQSRVLELAHETFARQWGTQLTAKIRVVSRVTFESVVMQSYDAYAASLPATSAMILCTVGELPARAVIQFPTAAALSWIGRMLGGADRIVAPERKFTPIEQALIRRLIDDALEDLRYSLGSLISSDPAVETIHYNSQFAQAAATSELMIVARFVIRVGEREDAASVAIPAEAMLHGLGDVNRLGDAGAAPALLRSQLARVPVQLALQLEPVRVGAEQILALGEGELIPIPHPRHRPFNVAVDGEVVATASAGTSGSRLACVIVETTTEK